MRSAEKNGFLNLMSCWWLAALCATIYFCRHYSLVVRGTPWMFFLNPAVIVGLLLWGVFTLIRFLSRRAGRSTVETWAWHRISICFMDGLGCVALCLLLNMCFDTSPPQQRRVAILDRYFSQGSRGRRWPHYIVVSDWRYPRENIQLLVTQDTYGLLLHSHEVSLITKSGFLKSEWIAEFIPADAEPPKN